MKQYLLNWLDVSPAELLYKKLNDSELLSYALDNESFVDDAILNILNWLENINQKFNILNEAAEENENSYKSMQEVNKSVALERSVGWDLLQGR